LLGDGAARLIAADHHPAEDVTAVLEVGIDEVDARAGGVGGGQEDLAGQSLAERLEGVAKVASTQAVGVRELDGDDLDAVAGGEATGFRRQGAIRQDDGAAGGVEVELLDEEPAQHSDRVGSAGGSQGAADQLVDIAGFVPVYDGHGKYLAAVRRRGAAGSARCAPRRGRNDSPVLTLVS
jgi:hypothetical protein